MNRLAILGAYLNLALALTSCGGGGGGGGGDVGGAIPLTTNVAGSSAGSISYNVTGSATDDSGTKPVTGTLAVYRIADQYLNSVLCDANAEQSTSIQIGSDVSVATTRFYGYRDQVSGVTRQAGARLSNGADIYFDQAVPAAPLTYFVGAGFDNSASIAGYDTNTHAQRWGASEFHWHVLGTGTIQTPLGFYECYIMSQSTTEYDYDTGVIRTSAATIYVRPEMGALYMHESVTIDDGVTTGTADLTYSATGST